MLEKRGSTPIVHAPIMLKVGQLEESRGPICDFRDQD